ncbi:MAG: hypothetical protein QM778_15570 [Myxococcales bacterium]
MQTRSHGLDLPRFARAWRALGAESTREIPQAAEILTAHYAHPARAYHNAEHIGECLAWFDRVSTQLERPTELEVALVFHDAIYDPCARDNEAQSRALFEQLAREAGLPDTSSARIGALISATERHAASSHDAAFMVDIDLAILGAEPERYARFERDVRMEFAFLDDAGWSAGRARVLQGFLARERLFETPFFRERLELRARANLARALSALGA